MLSFDSVFNLRLLCYRKRKTYIGLIENVMALCQSDAINSAQRVKHVFVCRVLAFSFFLRLPVFLWALPDINKDWLIETAVVNSTESWWKQHVDGVQEVDKCLLIGPSLTVPLQMIVSTVSETEINVARHALNFTSSVQQTRMEFKPMNSLKYLFKLSSSSQHGIQNHKNITTASSQLLFNGKHFYKSRIGTS